MSETIPDFTKIEFPSDKLTVEELRKAFPYGFDIDSPRSENADSNVGFRIYRRETLDDKLGCGIIDAERQLAQRAFMLALGEKIPRGHHLDWHIDDLIESLSRVYQEVGLAFGKHDSLALIQRIEKQAIAQAREFGGRGR